MSDIKLSFCIPTYNRANHIGQTLSSIADQIIEGCWTDSIEICVSDNASTDYTDNVIHNFQSIYPSVRLVYLKNNKNLGADQNYLRVVGMASGEYCWLFGSDDSLIEGSLKTITSMLNQNVAVYLGNRVNCNLDLKPVSIEAWQSCGILKTYDWSNSEELSEYLSNSSSIGALFSYLSCIIFNKSEWDNITPDNNFVGSAYIHVDMLLNILIGRNKILYIPTTLVYNRTGNDSFDSSSHAHRILLDLRGYTALANKYFNSNVELYNLFITVLYNECNKFYFSKWTRILRIKSFSHATDWNELVVIVNETFPNLPRVSVINVINKIPTSRTIMGLIKWIKNKIERNV